MKRFLCYLFLPALLAACTCLQAKAQQVNARLDTGTIALGDQTVLHLSIRFPAGDSIRVPALTDTITGKILIVSGKTDTVFDKNDIGIETISRRLTITSFEPGTHLIPAFTFRTKAGELKTQPLRLEVSAVAVDTTKAFYDIKQPLTVSYSLFDWLRDHWVWVAGGLALVLLIVAIVWYLRKRPAKEQPVQVVKERIPEHIVALRKLEELRDKKLWQQDHVKRYHSELSDILREYLEKRYHIKALEQTSEEIFLSLRAMDIAKEDRRTLRETLTLADLVKFAKERPLPAENERSLDHAVSFVKNTQRKEGPPVNKGGEQP